MKMKLLFVILVALLLPVSAMAMTPIPDSTLSDVTGQSGVNINADLTMNINIGTMAWGDADGIGGFNSGTDTSPWTTVAAGGYVGVSNFNINGLRIKARESDVYNGYFTSTKLKPITIDVATGTKLGTPNTTFVRFGLGSLYVGMNAMSLSIQMGPNHNLGQVLGTANLGPMDIYINPISHVDIYSHAGCGVNLEFDIEIDRFGMTYMSWGDTDGLPAGNPGNAGGVGNWIGAAGSAGYIGLQNISVGPIAITGTVAIDIVSIAAGQGTYAGQGIAPILGQGATTVVHISFPTNFYILLTGPITANVRLDSVAALNSANAGTLGDIYLQGFGLTIASNSWVDIWAH
jgi:hypothetical protein